MDTPDLNPPVEVKLRLPDCLIIPEEPVLACWDPESLIWRTNGIAINQFTSELNEISFITAVFGTFAVFQDFHLNMPFQHWEMRPLPRKVIKGMKVMDEALGTNSMNDEMESPGVESPATRRTSQTDMTSQAPPEPTQRQQMSAAAQPLTETLEVGGSGGAPSILSPLGSPPSPSIGQTAALGPLDSMGVPDDIFLADKTEADQCLIIITGAYIRVHLHVLDDRVAILAEDPKAILDPVKMAEEEAAAAAKAAGIVTTSITDEGGAEDAAANTSINAGSTSAAAVSGRRGLSGVSRFSRRYGGGGPNTTDDTLRGQLELEHLTGRWFTPDELICVLMTSGVNIFPRPDSCTRIECIDKNPLIEQRLYEQMALLSPVMAFGWSHWNMACEDPNSIILVATEHIDDDGPVDEERWKVYSVDRKYVYQLQISESGDKFKPDPEPNLHRHADFFHMYMEIGSEKGKERVRRIQSRYFKTVQRILKATRPHVFS